LTLVETYCWHLGCEWLAAVRRFEFVLYVLHCCYDWREWIFSPRDM